MKNKKLMGLLIGLTVLLVAYLSFSSLNSSKQDTGSSSSNEQTVASDSPAAKIEEGQSVKVGVLQYVTHASLDEIYRGFKDGLKEAGYTEGDNLEIDFMNAEGNQNQVQTMSEQLVANENDVLVGIATPSAQGLASATKEIPIVMGAVTDPVGANLINDLKEPGANVTGVSDHTPVADAVKLIQAISPSAKTIGVLYSSSEDNSLSQVKEFTDAAEAAGLRVLPFAIPSTNEIASTMNVMTSKVDVVWTPTDNTIASAFPTVVSAANEAKKPIYTSVEDMVKGGGLASVTLDQYQLGVATGKMVAEVLEGADPATTPVQIFETGTTVLNKTVADQLGITFPENILSQASQVIK